MAIVKLYERTDEEVPFEKWFRSLHENAAAKVTAAIRRMELGNFGDHKSVGNGVWERKIDYGKGFRLYYAKDGEELIVLLCGGTKSRQQKDIEQAKSFWADYRKRKKEDEGTSQKNVPTARSKKSKRRKT